MTEEKTSTKKEGALSEVKGHLEALTTGFKYFIDPHRMTLDYPAEAMELPKNYRGFFKLVDDKCIGCSLCEMVCPSNAITMLQLPPAAPKSSVPSATQVEPQPQTQPQAQAQAQAQAKPQVAVAQSQSQRPRKRPLVDWGLCIFCYFCVDVCPTEAFETSNVHDISYFEESEYRPTFDGFLRVPASPSRGAKRVVAKTDPNKGIRYEEVGRGDGK
ncbi:MAG: 4Fe-4S binding protein [Candidatus Marsarchaeota archaeon]